MGRAGAPVSYRQDGPDDISEIPTSRPKARVWETYPYPVSAFLHRSAGPVAATSWWDDPDDCVVRTTRLGHFDRPQFRNSLSLRRKPPPHATNGGLATSVGAAAVSRRDTVSCFGRHNRRRLRTERPGSGRLDTHNGPMGGAADGVITDPPLRHCAHDRMTPRLGSTTRHGGRNPAGASQRSRQSA